MKKNEKIFLAGHNGMVGKSLHQRLIKLGYKNIIVINRTDLDLRNQTDVMEFFKKMRPDYVILAAGRVGGIMANMSYPAEFLYDNATIYLNVIHFAHQFKVKKLLFISSSCSYPKDTSIPIKESQLTSGVFEPTNEPLAIAKVMAMRMIEYYRRQYNCNFVTLMPTNLYGPNDYFDDKDAHVMPALMRRIYEAKLNNSKEVVIWGTGKPIREFLYIEDFTDSVIFMLDKYDEQEHINIGSGDEVSIEELANLLKNSLGFEGKLTFDSSKPDGMFRKNLDITKATMLGWKSKTNLLLGIRITCDWFINNYPNVRGIS
jgi:GDP-L-fucose synthase